MPIDIQNKIALVTGANRGIGKAITESLVAAGVAKVYAAVRKPDSAAPLVEKYGDKILPVAFDLGDEASIKAAAETASDVQVVINNAGVLRTSGPLAGDAMDSLAFEMNNNFYGLIRTAQAFAPVLKANGGGAFVQLNSVVSVKAFPHVATYSASKAASYSYTQSLKWELAGDGIEVYSVHPGPIGTDMAKDAGLDHTEPPSVVADAILAAFKSGSFHVFPDSMAKQIGGAYAGFAENIVEADFSE